MMTCTEAMRTMSETDVLDMTVTERDRLFAHLMGCRECSLWLDGFREPMDAGRAGEIEKLARADAIRSIAGRN